GRLGGQAGEVLRQRQPGDVGVGRQEGLERHRRGELAGANKAARDLEDLLMDWLEEMGRLEKVGNAVERLGVEQDRAKERLLRLDVVRGGTIAGLGIVLADTGCRVELRHGFLACVRRRGGGGSTSYRFAVTPCQAVPVTHRMQGSLDVRA